LRETVAMEGRTTGGAGTLASGSWRERLRITPFSRRRQVATACCLLTVDLLALSVATGTAVWLRWVFGGSFTLAQYGQLWPLLAAFPAVFAFQGLYQARARSPAEELRHLVRSITLVFLLAGATAFLAKQGEAWSRGVYLMAWAFSLPAVPLARALVRMAISRRAWYGVPVLILGAGRTGELVVQQLHANPATGLRPVAMLDDDVTKHGDLKGVPVVGGLDMAPEIARECGVRHVVVAMPGADHRRLLELEQQEEGVFPHVILIPPLVGFAGMWVEARGLGAVLGLEVRRRLLLIWPRLIKRTLDLLGVILLGILVALPVMLLIASVIKLTSPGPVLYAQRRLGRGGREFTAWKFRSMVRDADAVLKHHLSAHPELRAEWERDHKLRHDPRVTAIGRLLRRTSMDELPQLWNVLVGQMSLVGPRPIVEAEVDKYGHQYTLYTRVRPGMSGLWQVSGRSDTSYTERVALDVYYVRNWSVWLDVYILAATVRTVLAGAGAR